MAIRTPEEYLQSLRDGRVVYSEGKKINDVTTDPLVGLCANAAAWDYAIAQMPEFRDTVVTKDETGEEMSFVFLPARSSADLLRRRKIIQILSRICFGLPGGAKFTGIDTLNSITVNSRIIDNALGSRYTARVEAYRSFLIKSDLAVVAGVTDAKGDRSLHPSKQIPHQDYYVHIVDETKQHGEDGIVVRGAKMFQSLAACANEIIVMPCRAMNEEDKDYAVVFATPLNRQGITMITSAEEPANVFGNDFDSPLATAYFTASGAVIFEDVFVPMERVFLQKEWEYSANFTYMFANFHRLSADAYKYAQLEIMVGLAALLAEYNGIEKAAHVRDKLSWLATYAETVEALGKAACHYCEPVPGTDLVFPNRIVSNCAKFHFASNFHEATKYVQDIAGGLPACAFSYKDYNNPKTRPLIDKYFGGKAGIPTEHRLRAMHLVRDLTSGYEDIVTIHAEGSLLAQQLAIYAIGDWDKYKAAAKRAARIDDGTPHPIFSKLPKFPKKF